MSSKYKNIIVYVKGVKKNISDVINYLNKKIELRNGSIIYINSVRFSYSNRFGFKKVKAIKRRLKKKIIKM